MFTYFYINDTFLTKASSGTHLPEKTSQGKKAQKYPTLHHCGSAGTSATNTVLPPPLQCRRHAVLQAMAMAATTATATTAFTACTDVGVLGRNGDDKDCVCFVCAGDDGGAAAARRTSGGMVIAGPHCLIGMFFIATLLLRRPQNCQGCQNIQTTLTDWYLSIQLKLKKKDYS